MKKAIVLLVTLLTFVWAQPASTQPRPVPHPPFPTPGAPKPPKPPKPPRRAPDPKVQEIQEVLKTKGYDPGPTDGLLGSKTHSAVRAFQKSERLPESGQLDAATFEKLGVKAAGPIIIPPPKPPKPPITNGVPPKPPKPPKPPPAPPKPKPPIWPK